MSSMACMLEPMKWAMGLEIPGPGCSFGIVETLYRVWFASRWWVWTFVGLLGFGLADEGRCESGMFVKLAFVGGLRVRICFFGTFGGLVWLDIDIPLCEWWDTCPREMRV
jgi:hypothetical protein